MNDEQLAVLTEPHEQDLLREIQIEHGMGTDLLGDVETVLTALADARLEVARLTEERDTRLRRKLLVQREDIRRLVGVISILTAEGQGIYHDHEGDTKCAHCGVRFTFGEVRTEHIDCPLLDGDALLAEMKERYA